MKEFRSIDLKPAALAIWAQTVWGEARGEDEAGRAAVAWVVRNRVERPRWWGRTIIGVCHHPQQFSCWNVGDPNRRKIMALDPEDVTFVEIRDICRSVADGNPPDPTGGATHYHVAGLSPYWARGKEPSVEIGNHVFYANVE